MKKVFFIILFSILLFANKSEPIKLYVQSSCGLYHNDPFTNNGSFTDFSLYIQNDKDIVGSAEERQFTIILDNQEYPLFVTNNSYNSYYYGYQDNLSNKGENKIDYELIQKLENVDQFKLRIKYPTVVKEKVEDKDNFYSTMSSISYDGEGNLVIKERPKKYKYVDKTVMKNKVYDAVIDKAQVEQAVSSCTNNINREENNKLFLEILIIIGILIGVYVAYRLIITFIQKTKQVAKTASNRIHEYKVQKIAEDEAIRATVNKAVKENDELGKLQDLINKAVARGDTETAKALLEILENKKSENDI